MAESAGEASTSRSPVVSSAIFIPATAGDTLIYRQATSYSLVEPSEATSGVFFAPIPPRKSPRQLEKSPRSTERASRRAGGGTRSGSNVDRSEARYEPRLVENTRKLNLSVAPRAPQPSLATEVTLSDRSNPCPKIIFEQKFFRKGKHPPPPTPPPPPPGDGSSMSLAGSTSRAPSLSTSVVSDMTGTLTSPTSTSNASPGPFVGTTPIASAIEVESNPASPRPSTNAWNKPRSWATLATKGDSGALSYQAPAPASSNVSPASGSVQLADSMSSLPSQSPSHRAIPASSSKLQGLNGKANGHSLAPKLSKMDTLMEDADKQFVAPLTYPRGMINKGNFCFANAILQVLVYCAPFYNLFQTVSENVPHDFNNSTPLMEAIIHFLKEFHRIPSAPRDDDPAAASSYVDLIREVQASSEPFVPEFVYEAMRLNKRFDLMRRGHQEDAEEFLGFILDTLHEELMAAMKKWHARSGSAGMVNGSAKTATTSSAPSQQGTEEGEEEEESEEREVRRPLSPSEEGWLEVGQKGKTSFTRTTAASESPITRIFGGKLRSVLKTPGVKDSVTLEPYQPLQLDIQPANVTSIDEALENLCAPETIPGVFSPARNGPVDATKQVFIETLPPVLILHLKRFVYDEVGGVQKSSKEISYGPTLDISDKVLSPTRRVEGKKKYRLFGVVYHHGRFASGGHYTVDVLRQDQSEWLHIDDTFWTSVGAPALKTSGEAGSKPSPVNKRHDGVAYLLFYAREDVIQVSSKTAATAETKTTVLPAKKTSSRLGNQMALEGGSKSGSKNHSRANSTMSQAAEMSPEKTERIVPGAAATASKKTAGR